MAKPTPRAIARTIAVLAALWLGACAQPGTYDTMPMTQSAAPAAAAPAAPQALKFASGDKLRISVAGAEKLNGEYEIDLSGAMQLPLLGTIAAAGKTPGEVQAEIARRLKDEKLMDNPNVTVALAQGRPFYALGEVKNPGKYSYVAGLNIISAIATAGGFTNRAEQAYVFVRHPGQPNELKVPLASALPVEPGDIVRVAARVF